MCIYDRNVGTNTATNIYINGRTHDYNTQRHIIATQSAFNFCLYQFHMWPRIPCVLCYHLDFATISTIASTLIERNYLRMAKRTTHTKSKYNTFFCVFCVCARVQKPIWISVEMPICVIIANYMMYSSISHILLSYVNIVAHLPSSNPFNLKVWCYRFGHCCDYDTMTDMGELHCVGSIHTHRRQCIAWGISLFIWMFYNLCSPFFFSTHW